MKIPQVREELLEIAEHLTRHALWGTASRIRTLVEEMKRRPGKRGRRTAVATHLVRDKIIWYRKNTPLSNQEIGQLLKIAPGRVTDVMRGERP